MFAIIARDAAVSIFCVDLVTVLGTPGSAELPRAPWERLGTPTFKLACFLGSSSFYKAYLINIFYRNNSVDP
jgi:hypothetical protein